MMLGRNQIWVRELASGEGGRCPSWKVLKDVKGGGWVITRIFLGKGLSELGLGKLRTRSKADICQVDFRPPAHHTLSL